MGSIPGWGTKIPHTTRCGQKKKKEKKERKKLSYFFKKSLQIINAGEGIEKKEPSYTVGGNINWCSHYGEQYGGSLKN